MINKEIILVKVQDIFRDVFDNENLIIKYETNSNDIEEWDSMNHINLIVAIENEFKIKFTLDELSSMNDVGSMVDLMSSKLIK